MAAEIFRTGQEKERGRKENIIGIFPKAVLPFGCLENQRSRIEDDIETCYSLYIISYIDQSTTIINTMEKKTNKQN